jgi:hypothetical protein
MVTMFAQVGKLSKHLPSRNWCIAGSVIATFSGWVWYDRRQCDQVRSIYLEKGQALASIPLAPKERVRKIAVFVMRPHPDASIDWSRKYFREYIKPVLDATALDYDLIEAYEPGAIAQCTSESIVEQQKYLTWTKEDALKASILSTPYDDLDFNFRRKEYDAFVAIGRKPFEEILVGYEQGIHQVMSNNVQKVESVAIQQDQKRSIFSFWNWSSSKSSNASLEREGIMTLPGVAYIPLPYQSGWRTWPIRIYKWINKRERVSELSEKVMGIASKEGVRPLSSEDCTVGWEEFGVQQALQIAISSSPNTSTDGVALTIDPTEEPVLIPEYSEVFPKSSNKRTPPKPEQIAAPVVTDLWKGATPGDLKAAALGAKPPNSPESTNGSNESSSTVLTEENEKEKQKEAAEEKRQQVEKLNARKKELWQRYFVGKTVIPQEMIRLHVPFYVTTSNIKVD